MLMELYFYLYNGKSSYFGGQTKVWTSFMKELSVGDAAMIQHLVEIGDQHQLVQQFIRKYHQHLLNPPEAAVQVPAGAYKTALARGMENALQPYYCTVAQLQGYTGQNIDALTPVLLDARRNLLRHAVDFEILMRIIEDVERQNLVGCQILTYLETNTMMVPLDDNGVLKKILITVNERFYFHLREWLMFGSLYYDTPGEFFIQAKTSIVSVSQNESFDEDEFEINPEQCPRFIRPEIFEQILEIGKTVHMILYDSKKSTKNHNLDMYFYWKCLINDFDQELWSLHEDYFKSQDFCELIDRYQQFTSERLWKMTIKNAALSNHLTVIRDYFLLGQGEIFQVFLAQNEKILRDKTSPFYSKVLNKAFKKTWCTINEFIEYPLENLNFYCMETDQDKPVWETIRLKYKFPWPLHVIFTKEIMHNYGVVFNFLLNLKNTDLAVRQLWLLHTDRKFKSKIDLRIVLLRNKCMYTIKNLLAYMQIDVIETLYTTFVSAVEKAKDFDTIKKAHWKFYSSMISETFLLFVEKKHNSTISSDASNNDNPVSIYLRKLLSTVYEFCTVASTWDVTLTEEQSHIFNTYEKTINDLLQYPIKLWSDKSTEYGVNINRFLTRMMNLY